MPSFSIHLWTAYGILFSGDAVTITLAGKKTVSVRIPNPAQLRKVRLWTELSVVLATIVIGLFASKSALPYVITFGLLWVALTSGVNAQTKYRLGLEWKNSEQTLKLVEFAALISLAVWVIGLAWGPARHIKYYQVDLLTGKIGYFVGAAVQQFVIQSYCFTRLEELLGCNKRACKLTAAIFSLCHLPNPLLMVITWYGGRITCSIFKEHRNLYTLAIAHGLIGASMAWFWPSWVMRAGIRFFKLFLGF